MSGLSAPGRWIVVAATIVAVPLIFLAARGHDTVDPADRARIESIVRDYILANPEIIPEAMQVLQMRAVQGAITEYHDALYNDPDGVEIGNPDGDVTIVEFFDYTCGFCRVMKAPLQRLLNEDDGVSIVLKEWPIRGEVAELASRAAIASRRQNLYVDYHFALFDRPGRLTEEAIFETARAVGLDVDQLQQDMTRPEVQAIITRNRQLGAALDLRGTPAFIIGNELIPGAMSYEDLVRQVQAARQAP